MTTKKNRDNVDRMFLFDNDGTGRATIGYMRKALNRARYTISVRGRANNRAEVGAGSLKEVPLDRAEQLVVYVKLIPVLERQRRERQEREIRERLSRVNNWEEEVR